mgnify:CR=1 FL=1
MPIGHGGLEGVRELPAMGTLMVDTNAACENLVMGRQNEPRLTPIRAITIRGEAEFTSRGDRK